MASARISAGGTLERCWRDIVEGLERYCRGARGGTGEMLNRDWRDVGEELEILERCWRDVG